MPGPDLLLWHDRPAQAFLPCQTECVLSCYNCSLARAESRCLFAYVQTGSILQSRLCSAWPADHRMRGLLPRIRPRGEPPLPFRPPRPLIQSRRFEPIIRPLRARAVWPAEYAVAPLGVHRPRHDWLERGLVISI